MGMFFGLLSLVAGFVSLGCLVMVVMKMFQEKGAMHAVLGFFCSIYALIWGWQNADRLDIKNVMIAWTAAIVAAIVLNVVVQSIAGA